MFSCEELEVFFKQKVPASVIDDGICTQMGAVASSKPSQNCLMAQITLPLNIDIKHAEQQQGLDCMVQCLNTDEFDASVDKCYQDNNPGAAAEQLHTLKNTLKSDGNKESKDGVQAQDLKNVFIVGSSVLIIEEENKENSEEQGAPQQRMICHMDEGRIFKRYQHARLAFGIVLRIVLPLANGMTWSCRQLLRHMSSSKQALVNAVAYAANTISLSLTTAQVSETIGPLLKLLRMRSVANGTALPQLAAKETAPLPSEGSLPGGCSQSLPSTPTVGSSRLYQSRNSLPDASTLEREQSAPKCCSLHIVAQPPPGVQIRADIVFIHGLHGSSQKTWRQGSWKNERKPQLIKRATQNQARAPKRSRYWHSFSLPTQYRRKRKRLEKQLQEELEQEQEQEQEAYENKENDACLLANMADDWNSMSLDLPVYRLHHDKKSLRTHKTYRRTSQEQLSNNKDRHDNYKACYSKCWPADWLPLDCPGVRIVALDYTTDAYLWRPVWKRKESRSNLVQRAREMTELLIEAQVGVGHPIVWVGHSKGGLFLKQIIVDAWESRRPSAAPFWRSARGIFFYSVPHRGASLACLKAPLLARSVELMELESNTKHLLELHHRFVNLYKQGHLRVQIFSFVETALTLMSVVYLRIVQPDSADPGIGEVCGMQLDHREICKPRSRECILYTELVNLINKVC